MFDTFTFIWNHPISSANRYAAFSRYVRWQVGTRLLMAPVVMPFVESTRLVCERSMTGATGNIYCGLHEFGDMGFLLHFLRPGDLFVDVGANIGSFSMLASGVVGARSVALEPVPSTFVSLKRNIAINGLEKLVDPLCVAAGAGPSTVRFSIDREAENLATDESYAGRTADVQVVALDEVAKISSPALLKVDVEGFEGDVLKGASKRLRSNALNAVLLEADSEAIRSVMGEAGFTRASYSPFSRRLERTDATRPASVDETVNHLWVRDFDFVEQRCRTGKRVTVHGTTF